MSRADSERARAWRAKKMNNFHCPSLRRRRRGEAAQSGEAASWLHWKGKVWSVARFGLYPASSVSGPSAARRAWGNPSCYCTILNFDIEEYMLISNTVIFDIKAPRPEMKNGRYRVYVNHQMSKNFQHQMHSSFLRYPTALITKIQVLLYRHSKHIQISKLSASILKVLQY